MDEIQSLKMAVISGASHALEYKKQNPRASDDEIIKMVSRDVKVILEKMEQED